MKNDIMSEDIGHDQSGVTVGIVKKEYVTFADAASPMALESGASIDQ